MEPTEMTAAYSFYLRDAPLVFAALSAVYPMAIDYRSGKDGAFKPIFAGEFVFLSLRKGDELGDLFRISIDTRNNNGKALDDFLAKLDIGELRKIVGSYVGTIKPPTE